MAGNSGQEDCVCGCPLTLIEDSDGKVMTLSTLDWQNKFPIINVLLNSVDSKCTCVQSVECQTNQFMMSQNSQLRSLTMELETVL